ncbi:MAG: hypothetical protein ACPLSM_07665 [Thermosphaera sp.]
MGEGGGLDRHLDAGSAWENLLTYLLRMPPHQASKPNSKHESHGKLRALNNTSISNKNPVGKSTADRGLVMDLKILFQTGLKAAN